MILTDTNIFNISDGTVSRVLKIDFKIEFQAELIHYIIYNQFIKLISWCSSDDEIVLCIHTMPLWNMQDVVCTMYLIFV